MSILVLNSGSSTLKFAVFDDNAHEELASGLVDWAGNAGQADFTFVTNAGLKRHSRLDETTHLAAVRQILQVLADEERLGRSRMSPIAVVGHRVVHGGGQFHGSTLVDAAAKTVITQLSELAPLHNPPALAAIEAAEAALPGVPHVVVFDTAYFADLSPSQYVYPLPYEWYTDWGIRRFGFHGISHAYCAGRAAELLGRDSGALRFVICHLGNGCSASAVRDGVAVATTMGFTPLEGLMMGTRCGSIDPGILLYLERRRGVTAEALDHALNHLSGLLGVSGMSSDFRRIEQSAREGNDRARLAFQMYAERIRATVGALAVTLGGLDALVFTAGVGENSVALRAGVCEGLQCLGLELAPEENATCVPDADIAASNSAGRILVIHTREDLLIAREARRVALALDTKDERWKA